jgi:PAS domain S-box-containing protein
MTKPGQSKRTLRLLHLEDDPHDAELALDVLAQGGYECEEERVDAKEAFVSALERAGSLDLILADYILPRFDAVDALAIARRLRPDVPFILVSGRVGEETAIDMLHAGATDYVLKQRLDRLLPAVNRALREKALEEERQVALNQLADVVSRLEAKNLLERVVAQLPAGIILAHAPSGRILVLNQRAEYILDLDRSQLRTVADIARAAVYTPDGKRATVEQLPSYRALTKGESVRDTLFEFRHRDGESVFALINSTPVRDPAGNVLAVVASYTDITELRRAQAEARSLAQFPEESPAPVMRSSAEGEVLYANRPAAVLLDAIGWHEGSPLPAPLLAPVQAVVRRGAPEEVELNDARDRVHLFTLSPAPGERYVNLYGRDITDRKRSEDALREADRHKTEFLGVLSHELRNPLAPILNSIHILDRVPEGSDQALRARAVIARQTNQLARLVDDLLDVTRVARGKIRLHRAPVDVTELVRHAVDDHRPLFDSRGIELSLRVDVGRQWIDADSTRITQVIGNLLQNAAKFTNAHGHVLVTVAPNEHSDVVIRVTDDGVGMTPEMLGRVFQPFTQADESLHRTFGGLGLGLALVKGLVEMHDGRVQAFSRGACTGSEFCVSFPVLREVGVPPEEPLTPEHTGRLRLLVIEDNLDAAETLKDVLEMNGHEVAVAHDGQEGIEKARSLKPDVVLCDIGLPGRDGYEVARAIREDPTISPTMIAMTGYTLPQDLKRSFEAGFDHHLGKPVEMRSLERVLANVMVHPTSRRILVVEDNDALRDNIRELLANEGWEVREARNGEEAVEAVARFDPAVMLLDYRLPHMQGAEVLRQLATFREAPRVVLMTASAQVREIAKQHGLRFFVPKPFRGPELLDAVENAREGA